MQIEFFKNFNVNLTPVSKSNIAATGLLFQDFSTKGKVNIIQLGRPRPTSWPSTGGAWGGRGGRSSPRRGRTHNGEETLPRC